MYHIPHSPFSVRVYSDNRDIVSVFESVHGPSAKPKPTIPSKYASHIPGTSQCDHSLLTTGTHYVFDSGVPALNVQEGLTREDYRMYARQCMAIRNLVGRVNKCNDNFPIRPLTSPQKHESFEPSEETSIHLLEG